MRIVQGLFATFSLGLPIQAFAHPEYESPAPIAYMIDMTSGSILYDKGSTRKIPPASMAKMMTAYVTFDLLQRGKLSPDQKFAVRPETWKKWNNKGSSMFLKPGQQVSVDNLLYGVITVSGNDAAVVLAEGIAGTEAKFVQSMNAKAKQLGMRDSDFHTANGWPDNGRTLTTARDLAVLGARTIHDFPDLYRKYYGLTRYRWNNITQPNRNPLLGLVSGADGVKTGHTGQAGYCFTGTADQNGRRIMMVVAGLGTMEARANESRRFLQWGFSAWRVQPLYNAHAVVATLPVQLGERSSIQAIAPRKLALALPARDAQRYKLIVRYTGPIKAPLKKGTQVAILVAKFENGTERTMPLVAAQSVAKAGYFGRLLNGFRYVIGQ